MSTLIQQFATKKALVQSIAGVNKEMQAKSSLAMMNAAVMCQKDIANASGSYSYSGSSYGSFVEEHDSLVALEAATIIENITQKRASYSYSGGSYGVFIEEVPPQIDDPSEKENTVEKNNVAKKQTFFAKHKYAILALGAVIAGYFVFRKK